MINFGLLHLFESAEGKTEHEFIQDNLAMARCADEAGLDSIWMAEHHFTDYGVMPSIQVMSAYLAAHTRRLRLGAGVVVLPFHNPIRVAEEMALIDQLSEGRVDFGVGRGYQPVEFEAYGIPFGESRERFDECLQVIQQSWTQEEVNFEGKHYQYKGIRPRPRPFQQPHPPIFGASFNPATIKFQAMKRLNLLFPFLMTKPDKIAEYRQTLRDGGENPDDYRIGGLTFTYLDEDYERALADFEEPCMWYFRNLVQLIPKEASGDEDGYYRNLGQILRTTLKSYEGGEMSFRWMVEQSPFSQAFLVGDAAHVRPKLARLMRDYEGLTDILCWTRLGGLDHNMVMRSMSLFVDQVIKPLRAGEPLVVSEQVVQAG